MAGSLQPISLPDTQWWRPGSHSLPASQRFCVNWQECWRAARSASGTKPARGTGNGPATWKISNAPLKPGGGRAWLRINPKAHPGRRRCDRMRMTLFRLAIAFLPALLTGCAAIDTGAIEGRSTDAGWVCHAFQPIRWSREDTVATARQILEHNAVWDSLCDRSPP